MTTPPQQRVWVTSSSSRLDRCICAEPLRLGDSVKPCPQHGLIGDDDA